jgi:hypothetical protein
MEQEILRQYRSCIRFDQGALYHSKEYADTVAEEERMRALMVDSFGPQILPLLEEYTAALYGEMELEAQHYFEQGYRSGK